MTSGMKDQPKTKQDSEITFSQLMLPTHANFNGKVHGGYILEMMDQIAFACASKHSGTYCVTASVNTVDFLQPVEVGELLTMKASINYVGSSSMEVGIRVESQNITDKSQTIKHCNSSYFTMVAMDKEGNKQQVPGLVLSNRDDLRRFTKSIARREMVKKRRAQFAEKDFVPEEHIDQIRQYNVSIDY
jgi:acyl-CoA hydrolase